MLVAALEFGLHALAEVRAEQSKNNLVSPSDLYRAKRAFTATYENTISFMTLSVFVHLCGHYGEGPWGYAHVDSGVSGKVTVLTSFGTSSSHARGWHCETPYKSNRRTPVSPFPAHSSSYKACTREQTVVNVQVHASSKTRKRISA